MHSEDSGNGENIQESGFYTLHEVAKELRMSIRTVGQYLRDGRIKGLKLKGHWRIHVTEMDRMRAAMLRVQPPKASESPCGDCA